MVFIYDGYQFFISAFGKVYYGLSIVRTYVRGVGGWKGLNGFCYDPFCWVVLSCVLCEVWCGGLGGVVWGSVWCRVSKSWSFELCFSQIRSGEMKWCRGEGVGCTVCACVVLEGKGKKDCLKGLSNWNWLHMVWCDAVWVCGVIVGFVLLLDII